MIETLSANFWPFHAKAHVHTDAQKGTHTHTNIHNTQNTHRPRNIKRTEKSDKCVPSQGNESLGFLRDTKMVHLFPRLP